MTTGLVIGLCVGSFVLGAVAMFAIVVAISNSVGPRF